MEERRRASVLLLCGLPGSGKSTLVSSIVRNWNPKEVGGNMGSTMFGSYRSLVVIDYDDIADMASSKPLEDGINDVRAASESSVGVCDKERIGDELVRDRQQSDDNVDVISSDSKEMPAFTGSDLVAWREARTIALRRLDEELRSHFEEEADETAMPHGPTFGAGSNEEVGSGSRYSSVLIILDDNFHLRSMRRDVYRVCQNCISAWETDEGSNGGCSSAAKDFKIGFSVALIDTPVSVCLERNRSRPVVRRVPNNVIENMSESLERPDPDRFKFESSSVILPSCHGGKDDNADAAIDLEKERLHKLNACLQMALDHCPVAPPQPTVDPEVLKRERLRTLQSRVHRYDRMLRVLVGAVSRTDKTYARRANEARKHILDNIRKPDSSTWEAVQSRDINELRDCDDLVLEHFIQKILDENTAFTVGTDLPNESELVTAIRESYRVFREEYESK